MKRSFFHPIVWLGVLLAVLLGCICTAVASGDAGSGIPSPSENMSTNNGLDLTEWDAFESVEFEQDVVGKRIVATDDTTGFASTIHTDKYANTFTPLPSVVGNVAGVHVSQSGGVGSFSYASIRGSTANQVPIYIDEIQLNAGGFTSVNLGNLELKNFKSIEIYRGQTPLRLGGGGIGGAINLVTPDIDKRTEFIASLGSFRTMDTTVLHSQSMSKSHLLIIGNVQHAQNDFPYYNNYGTLHTTTDDSYQRRSNNHHTQAGILLKLSGKTAKWHWHLLNDFMHKTQGLAGILNLFSTQASLESHRILLGGAFTRSTHQRVELRISPSLLFNGETFADPANEIGTGVQNISTVTSVATLPVTVTLDWNRKHNTVFHGSARHQNLTQTDSASMQSTTKHWMLTSLFGIAHRITLHRWMFNGVALGQLYNSRNITTGQEPSFLSADAPSQNALYFTPSLGARFEILEDFFFRVNGGKYIRYPSLIELYGGQGYKVGNPNLLPETGYNTDAGFSLNKNRAGGLTFIHAEMVVFRSWVNNLIAYVHNSQKEIIAKNISDARLFGIETNLSVAFAKRLAIDANYTFLHPINHSNTLYNHKILPGRPKHKVFGKIAFHRSFLNYDCSLWTDADYTAQNYMDQANLRQDMVSRFFIGAGVNMKIPKHRFSVSLEVKNLLNRITATDSKGNLRQIRDLSGFPLPGRRVFTTLRWMF